MKVIAFFILFTFVLSSCNEKGCSDNACFTPPEFFRFQFIEKDTDKDLLANGTIDFEDIKVADERDGSIVNFSKISGDNFKFIEFNNIGWETEKVTYNINVQELLEFSFYVDAENITEDCCTFTRMNEVGVSGANYEQSSDGLYKILIQ